MLSLRIEINQPGWIPSSKIGYMFSPYQFRRWFEYYQPIVEKYAVLCERLGVQIFSIGSDLFHLSKHDNNWSQIIKSVREKYKGQLTYSSSIKEEFRGVGFWEDLDFIGVIADLPYRVHQHTSEADMRLAIMDFERKVNYLHKAWKRPILVT